MNRFLNVMFRLDAFSYRLMSVQLGPFFKLLAVAVVVRVGSNCIRMDMLI